MRRSVAAQKRVAMVRKIINYILVYAGLIAIAIFMVGPFAWLLSTSINISGNVYAFPPQLVPKPDGLDNFVKVWTAMPFGRYFFNTVHITLVGVGLSLLLASMAGYPLARLTFPGRNIIFGLILSTMMIPNSTGMIVNFVTLQKMKLVDTIPAVYLPSAVSAFGIFLMRQTYITIPRDLEDAARIDGCSELRIWLQIMLPLVKPGLISLAIFEFVAYWGTFLWPLIILQDPNKYPMAAGLQYLQGMFAFNFRYIAAGGVISIIPVIIMFLVLQRHFVSGLHGALKG